MHTQPNGQTRIVAYGQDATTGNYRPLVIDDGALNVNIYTQSNLWKYAPPVGGLVNSAAAVTIAPAATGKRNYLTSFQLQAGALGVATEFAIRDGAAGTVLWRFPIGTVGLVNGLSISLPIPLRSSVNTLLEIVTITASGTGAVYFDAQGFVGT